MANDDPATALNDPYHANLRVWHTKTHTHLTKNGPPADKAAHNSLAAAKEAIAKHQAGFLAAQKSGNKEQVAHHEKHIEMFKGAHDGILHGLSKAGYIPQAEAKKKSFRSQSLPESADQVYEDFPLKHQLQIAKATLKMSDAGANIMGGMSKPEAAKLVVKHHGKEHAKSILQKSGHNEKEIKKLLEYELPKTAINAPDSVKRNLAFSRLSKTHQNLQRASQAANSARRPGERAKAARDFENAKREHIRAKAEHNALRKLGEAATKKYELQSVSEGTFLLSEIGSRWFEDYHGRAHKVGLTAHPEKVKKGVTILRAQMKKHNAAANLHQDIAHSILDKHEAKKYSEIPSGHDRRRAIYHSGKSDYHRRKEAGAYWAHSGLRKAAQARNLLQNDPDRGHYAAFKESAPQKLGGVSRDLKEHLYHIVDTHTGQIVSSHKGVRGKMGVKASPATRKKMDDLNAQHWSKNRQSREGRYEILHKDEYDHKAKLGLFPRK